VKINAVTLKMACLGMVSFWLPDVLLHAVRRFSFDSSDVRIVTLAMPLTLFLACAAGVIVCHLTVRATAIRMLAGIWLSGGIWMLIGASFSGGGFMSLDVRGALFLTAISWIPLYTFIAATYDGSLGALVLASVGLFLAWILPLSGLKLNLVKWTRRNDP